LLELSPTIPIRNCIRVKWPSILLVTLELLLLLLEQELLVSRRKAETILVCYGLRLHGHEAIITVVKVLRLRSWLLVVLFVIIVGTVKALTFTALWVLLGFRLGRSRV